MQTNKKLFSLGIYDAFKGIIVAVMTAALTGLSQFLNVGHIPTSSEWKVVAISGIGAGVAYVLKNFLTNSQGIVLQSEAKAAQNPN